VEAPNETTNFLIIIGIRAKFWTQDLTEPSQKSC